MNTDNLPEFKIKLGASREEVRNLLGPPESSAEYWGEIHDAYGSKGVLITFKESNNLVTGITLNSKKEENFGSLVKNPVNASIYMGLSLKSNLSDFIKILGPPVRQPEQNSVNTEKIDHNLTSKNNNQQRTISWKIPEGKLEIEVIGEEVVEVTIEEHS